jgi:hypothetical protein
VLGAAAARPLWRADVSPLTVIVRAAPDGYANAPIVDTSTLPVVGEWLDDDLHAIAEDEAGLHRLWFQGARAPFGAAALIPFDENYWLRRASTDRFYRWLEAKPSGPLPRSQRLSPYESHRYGLMLQAWDGVKAGATRRRVASVVLNRDVMKLRAVEWKNAPERRRLDRMISTTASLIGGGYFRILQGQPLRVHLFRPR